METDLIKDGTSSAHLMGVSPTERELEEFELATEKPSPYWIKVKNRRYSQLEGREELFERG